MSIKQVSIFLTISLVLFAKISLAFTKPVMNSELSTQIKRNNEINSSLPVETWFQQGMNLDSFMFKQFFNNHIYSHYFTLQEDPKQFLISFELPGVDPKKIRVSVSQGILYVQANNDKTKHSESNSYYFSYHVSLPENANTQKMSAILKRGILLITIEKTNKLAAFMVDIPVKEIA